MYPLNLFDTPEGIATIKTAFDKRGFDPNGGLLQLALAAREDTRNATTALYDAREKKNALSRQFGELKKKGEPTDGLTAELTTLSFDIEMYEQMVEANQTALNNAVAMMPNIPAEEVPVGDETANRMIPEPHWALSPPMPEFDFEPKDHVAIGTAMKCMDFDRAAGMSGSRFVVLSGALAKLERVLGQWMVDHAAARNYTEMSVPHLVHKDAMFGTGQLPKFEEDLFRAGDHYLIPTAEVPLTNMIAGRISEIAEDHAQTGPINLTPWVTRMCALTPCYRAEAGSAGRDTRGMMRMHQFMKCELVAICHPDQSDNEHEFMANVAKNVLIELGLPFRTVLLASGDMGFSARKTYDLEVWLPSERKYREISSISNCGDFQARRMNARWKYRGEKGGKFPHTLNGSGVAVGRALLAIIENNQTEQGGIGIPLVLRERMGGSLIAPDGTII